MALGTVDARNTLIPGGYVVIVDRRHHRSSALDIYQDCVVAHLRAREKFWIRIRTRHRIERLDEVHTCRSETHVKLDRQRQALLTTSRYQSRYYGLLDVAHLSVLLVTKGRQFSRMIVLVD
jgi:hypothetical protein